MKVIVNGKSVELFEGATVEHAIQKFAPAILKAVKQGLLQVTDKFGNNVGLSGSLSDGETLNIQEVVK